MKVTVFITPRKNVLDPQGAAVGHAMAALGFSDSRNVRVGKTVAFDLPGPDGEELQARLHTLCRDLLSNPVIEDYRFVVEDV